MDLAVPPLRCRVDSTHDSDPAGVAHLWVTTRPKLLLLRPRERCVSSPAALVVLRFSRFGID